MLKSHRLRNLHMKRSKLLTIRPYKLNINSEIIKDIPDRVASPHPDPLRDWPILLKLLGQLSLDAEGLVRTLE